MLDEKLIEKQFLYTSDTDLLAGLVSILRPKRLRQAYDASLKLDQLSNWLLAHTPERYRLRDAVSRIISSADLQYIFSESGLPTSSGFFAELSRKLVEKMLPTLLPQNDLRISIRKIFSKSTDYRWINQMPESSWYAFFKALRLNVTFEKKHHLEEVTKAGETLSYRVASLGLDRRLLSKSADILEPYNAFVEQNKEWLQFSKLAMEEKLVKGDASACNKMLQCIATGLLQIKEIKNRTKEKGTSLQQTFLTERIEQHLLRLETIVKIIDPTIDVSPQEYTRYFKEVVQNENTHNKLGVFLSLNFSYLAYEIAEHGSRTGEKYITNNFKEYRKFFWSAAIGGVIISFAAFIKIGLTALHQPYFWASLTYGINYALAFVIIHLLHGTIATKQPALTASTIATALDNTNPKSPSLHNMALMNAKVFRSQLASLIGNLIVVLPLTVGIAWAMHRLTGDLLVPLNSVQQTLATVRPSIENVWFAAIAGVLLFLSGIISGYFDNMVIYGNIPQRLRYHRGLKRLLGERFLQKVAIYIEKNLGAIMGNVLLGFGLGFMIFFGKILGLPLDIRHVTISTGFFGFSWYSTGFALHWKLGLICASGLVLIAFTNLTVSFALALFTALKSRSISFKEIIPLGRLTLHYFIKFPFDFFFPPKKERHEQELWRRGEID